MSEALLSVLAKNRLHTTASLRASSRLAINGTLTLPAAPIAAKASFASSTRFAILDCYLYGRAACVKHGDLLGARYHYAHLGSGIVKDCAFNPARD